MMHVNGHEGPPGQVETVGGQRLLGTGWAAADSTGRIWGETLSPTPEAAREKYQTLHVRDMLLASAHVQFEVVAVVVLEQAAPPGRAPAGPLGELAGALAGLGDTLIQIGQNAKVAADAAMKAAAVPEKEAGT